MVDRANECRLIRTHIDSLWLLLLASSSRLEATEVTAVSGCSHLVVQRRRPRGGRGHQGRQQLSVAVQYRYMVLRVLAGGHGLY
jgi:hypothetical protein